MSTITSKSTGACAPRDDASSGNRTRISSLGNLYPNRWTNDAHNMKTMYEKHNYIIRQNWCSQTYGYFVTIPEECNSRVIANATRAECGRVSGRGRARWGFVERACACAYGVSSSARVRARMGVGFRTHSHGRGGRARRGVDDIEGIEGIITRETERLLRRRRRVRLSSDRSRLGRPSYWTTQHAGPAAEASGCAAYLAATGVKIWMISVKSGRFFTIGSHMRVTRAARSGGM